MIEWKYKIQDAVGFHARPARQLVELINTINSQVFVTYKGKKVSSKSLVKLVSLGVVTQEEILVTVEGGNEEENFKIVKDFFENNA